MVSPEPPVAESLPHSSVCVKRQVSSGKGFLSWPGEGRLDGAIAT
jgi:hypothetical protein